MTGARNASAAPVPFSAESNATLERPPLEMQLERKNVRPICRPTSSRVAGREFVFIGVRLFHFKLSATGFPLCLAVRYSQEAGQQYLEGSDQSPVPRSSQ